MTIFSQRELKLQWKHGLTQKEVDALRVALFQTEQSCGLSDDEINMAERQGILTAEEAALRRYSFDDMCLSERAELEEWLSRASKNVK